MSTSWHQAIIDDLSSTDLYFRDFAWVIELDVCLFLLQLKKLDGLVCNDTHYVDISSQCWRRDHFVYVPSQWETTLHCNVVSHWLGAYTKWFLLTSIFVVVSQVEIVNKSSRLIAGRISLKLWLDWRTSKLHVTVLCAQGLLPREGPEKEMPQAFVKLYLLPNRKWVVLFSLCRVCF